MRRHPEISSYIVAELELPAIVKQMVRGHHERYDGTGYPDGLAGEEIPLAARILSVADALDAMTSDRPYRSALPLEDGAYRGRGPGGPPVLPARRGRAGALLDSNPDFFEDGVGATVDPPASRQAASAAARSWLPGRAFVRRSGRTSYQRIGRRCRYSSYRSTGRPRSPARIQGMNQGHGGPLL